LYGGLDKSPGQPKGIQLASLQEIGLVLFIGIGATAVLDIWLVLLGRMACRR
jgi:hypothetical protein